jgi:FkbM family methyltransferase
MSVPLLRNLRWLLRHPGSLVPLLSGARFADLVRVDELRRLGIDAGPAGARGLAASHLSVGVVARLVEVFGDDPPLTFLDVGAAHGGYSAAAVLAFPDVHAVAFEPLPDVFAVLEETAAARGRITALPLALGDTDGRQVIHRSASTGSSSLRSMCEEHERHFPGTGTVGTEEIEVRTLDGLVAAGEVELTPPTLLKIDVQGFEDRVLAGAERTLPRIATIIVEVSLTELYEDQPLLPEVRSWLEERGFEFEGPFTEGRSVTTDEVVQIDALFRRRN